MNSKKLKPFVSYIGSKNKIIDKIDQRLPESITRYFEPFVGGGSVLFHIEHHFPFVDEYFINDKEPRIMELYASIRNHFDQMVDVLTWLNTRRSKKDFLRLLDTYNDSKKLTKVERSALYMYLLKLSFNSNLKFDKVLNKVKPTYSSTSGSCNIFNRDNLYQVSKFLKRVYLYNEDYVKFMSRFTFKKGDFVFLDPPYQVEFVGEYYSNIFTREDYKRLLAVCDNLHKKGALWMITLDSNEDHVQMFRRYNIHSYKRHSYVSNGLNRDKEIIITNY